MDARRESEPTPMKNRTTVERKSEGEAVVGAEVERGFRKLSGQNASHSCLPGDQERKARTGASMRAKLGPFRLRRPTLYSTELQARGTHDTARAWRGPRHGAPTQSRP